MSLFGFSASINNLVGNTPGANVSDLVQVLNDLKTFLNGANIDSVNIADGAITAALMDLADQQALGLNDSAQVGRGKKVTATSQTTNSTSYTTLSTADTVAGIVLPTDGLIHVYFRSLWKVNGGTGSAAIFVGSNQLKAAANAGGAPAAQETTTTSGFAAYLQSTGQGLTTNAGTVASDQTLVTTGQSLNAGTTAASPVCTIEAAAGTYDISLKFKNSLGGANLTTVSNRALWVRAEAFG